MKQNNRHLKLVPQQPMQEGYLAAAPLCTKSRAESASFFMAPSREAVFEEVSQWGRNLVQVLHKRKNLTGVHMSWFGDHVNGVLLIPLAYQIPIDDFVQLSELITLHDLCYTRGWGHALRESYFYGDVRGKTFDLFIIGPTKRLTFDKVYNEENSWALLQPSVIGATDDSPPPGEPQENQQ